MRTLIEFEKNIDPVVAGLLLFMGIVCGIGGWAVCGLTHRQRGIEVDRPVTDALPLPPPPVIVPDHVPDDWAVKS